ncbi:NAD(P)H-dependent oxidoreductase [Cyclobacterium jeungdonense]|uniref:NAD(P)-dependent oxidoreductase n=1 Tax=Cyclobacterium jeungdonense TaxID=708087 RepID=A0ABT8C1U5_9BACT|nr:Gfo/Idh/MocA family oxidoreductase [Cyclobacterium jeungdonense]MDN3686711.1 NAD(P)-dependent oxidoreductase [Cyclobacterium jeungdonense]
MILIDTALQKREEENNPIRVGMIGAGFMAKGIAIQMELYTPGMKLVAIANRTVPKAREVFQNAGHNQTEEVTNLSQLESALRADKKAISTDPLLLCQASGIDAIIEVTGAVEFGARVALEAIDNGKHLIMMNAEADGTFGPILKVYADKKGVIFTNADGDQPGVTLNLYRYVRQIGLKPVLCGNIKGLHDPYRNPTTQEGFAKKWNQNPVMVTSFADGSKISFEQAITANATGMKVAKRGMHGPTVEGGKHVRDCLDQYPAEDLLKGDGIVDYIVGASPGPGVFVLGTMDHPIQKTYLNLYKVGEGPFYCFYNPYHLCHFEVPITVARAVLFHDATIAPVKPMVDVVATAKKDLKKGEVLDGIGQYMMYGLCENMPVSMEERLLPLGLAGGCVLKRDVPKDQVITYDDVQVPEGRISDRLRAEQNAYFFPKA